MKHFPLILFLYGLGAAFPAFSQVPSNSLPDRIYLRTATETFTETRYLALRDGRIWVKPNPQTGRSGPWELLNGTGLPQNPEDQNFKSPTRIVEITAEMDVDHLIAVADTGVIYDLEGFAGHWRDSWGLPATHLRQLPGHRALAVSRRGPRSTLTDRAGHVHQEIDGVTTVYLLSQDGLTIRYGDAWLPDFENFISLPLRGRFRAQTLAASGSLLMVMDRTGEMYTRLADFDTEGCDPLYFWSYTYETSSFPWQRVLPGEGWIRQPRITGRLTGRIGVVQTGLSSRDRELRAEGTDSRGRTGYFAKPAYGGSWNFIPADQVLPGPFLDSRETETPAPDLGPVKDLTLGGTLKVNWILGSREIPVTVRDFDPEDSPALVSFDLGGERWDCPLHIRHFYFKGLLLAALELPDRLRESPNPEVRGLVRWGWGNQRFIFLQLSWDGTTAEAANLFRQTEFTARRP